MNFFINNMNFQQLKLKFQLVLTKKKAPKNHKYYNKLIYTPKIIFNQFK